MVIKMLQAIVLGIFITVDAAMLVYIMGPVRSRPFTNILHTSVGVGFWLGTIVVRPFLPDIETEVSKEKHRIETCQLEDSTNSTLNVTDATLSTENDKHEEVVWMGLEKVFWPYVVTGIFGILVSSLYLAPGMSPWKMPVFEEECKPEEMPNRRDCRSWQLLLIGVFIFWMLSCGIERIYQPIVSCNNKEFFQGAQEPFLIL